ncbi:hypothetical protein MMC11_007389 [Xylographa trunciseda]|nr:hypothetical protein [Xylographa trunciseda]
MASPIAVYSLPDLKNTTDDALPNYLTSLDFKQSHFLTDVRLAFGYSAVVIAAVTFGFDYKLGWDETKEYTYWAVIAYFLLNGVLTLWIWFAEKGKIFQGVTTNGTLLTIASSVTKHNPMYQLVVRWTDPATSEPFDWESREISAPFTMWFSSDGQFIAKPFQQWLSSEIPVIAAASMAGSSKKTGRESVRPELPDEMMQTTGPALNVKSRKGGK